MSSNVWISFLTPTLTTIVFSPDLTRLVICEPATGKESLLDLCMCALTQKQKKDSDNKIILKQVFTAKKKSQCVASGQHSPLASNTKVQRASRFPLWLIRKITIGKRSFLLYHRCSFSKLGHCTTSKMSSEGLHKMQIPSP